MFGCRLQKQTGFSPGRKTRRERLARPPSETRMAGVSIPAMTAERLPLGLPGPRRSVENQQALVEQMRRMASYLHTAAVLEFQSKRCEPSPGSAVLCECAQRRRRKAARIRDRLTSHGVTLSRTGSLP